MLFSYTARTTDGELITGQAEAADRESLALQLKNDGLLLTSAESDDEYTKNASVNSLIEKLQRIGTIPLEERMFFTQNLHVMLHSGISLSKALRTLEQQTKNKRFAYILAQIYTSVEKGNSLASSLEPHQNVFGELYVNMVAAGETSGQLEETLLQLKLQMKKDHDLRSKVKGAMIYPTIVIIAMIGVMITVITFVIPKISTLFTESNVALPLPTRILIATSDFTIANGWYIAVVVILLIVLFLKYVRVGPGQPAWHKFLIVMPVGGTIIKKINLARFARTLSSLMKTDIPIVKSFEITSKTLSNYHYKTILASASEQLKKGIGINTVLKQKEQLFPPIITQMVEVGEESGSLDTILENLADFYEEEVADTMANFSSIIEPVLILLLGLGVAGIAVSVIMPIYTLTQAV